MHMHRHAHTHTHKHSHTHTHTHKHTTHTPTGAHTQNVQSRVWLYSLVLCCYYRTRCSQIASNCVQVLKEEIAAQEPTYDQFLNCGHAILDRCDPESRDGKAISRKLDTVSKAWNHLQSRLDERSKSLTSVEGISTEFASLTRDLANWMSDFTDRLDGLGPVSNQPDKQEQQLEQLKVSELTYLLF